MKIKKLIVRKTKPSEEVIREIQFNEKGLNLIIDDTPESLRESGNSVGKSTAIKIIDLCLGARSVRELYYDSDTRSENVVVKNFLDEFKTLKNPKDIILIPLGRAVEDVLLKLSKDGLLDENIILKGFPHPSGANVNRIAQFNDNKESMMKFLKDKSKILKN